MRIELALTRALAGSRCPFRREPGGPVFHSLELLLLAPADGFQANFPFTAPCELPIEGGWEGERRQLLSLQGGVTHPWLTGGLP